MMTLNSIFGWNSGDDDRNGEREPLLHDEAATSSNAGASTSYGATSSNPRFVVPKPPKVKTPVRVEAKVWLANERTWISWLHVSLLIGSFSLALFNSSSFFSHHHP